MPSPEISFDAMNKADENLLKITPERLTELKNEKGITHIILPNEAVLPFKVVTRNTEYTIYEL